MGLEISGTCRDGGKGYKATQKEDASGDDMQLHF